MEVRNLNMSGWYTSYMDDKQGVALVECLKKKIEHLTGLLENIKGEIELAEEPKDHDPPIVLASIKAMIEQTHEVEHVVGSFKWVG